MAIGNSNVGKLDNNKNELKNSDTRTTGNNHSNEGAGDGDSGYTNTATTTTTTTTTTTVDNESYSEESMELENETTTESTSTNANTGEKDPPNTEKETDKEIEVRVDMQKLETLIQELILKTEKYSIEELVEVHAKIYRLVHQHYQNFDKSALLQVIYFSICCCYFNNHSYRKWAHLYIPSI